MAMWRCYQAVRARWSKEKIIAVWIPPPAATSEVAKATARQSIDGGDRTIGLPGDYGEQPIDDARVKLTMMNILIRYQHLSCQAYPTGRVPQCRSCSPHRRRCP